jgi:hypothetical protein
MSAVVEHTNGWVSFVERAMSNPDYSVDKLQTLLEMRRTEAREAARHDFNRAMAQVQSELQQVSKDKPNPAHRSKYATLAALLAEAQPVYTQHGFSLRFGTGQAVRPDWVRVTCEIAHLGGWSEQHYLDGPIDTSGNKTPIQTIGSTVTYLRRYLLMMLLNLVTADEIADDDGEASRRQPTNRREEINHDVPMRSAAASMQRGDRITEKASPTKTKHPPRTGEQWNVWMDDFERMCASMYERSDFETTIGKPEYSDVIAAAPPPVRRDIDALIAATWARVAAVDPSDDLPELEIAGEEKAASG